LYQSGSHSPPSTAEQWSYSRAFHADVPYATSLGLSSDTWDHSGSHLGPSAAEQWQGTSRGMRRASAGNGLYGISEVIEPDTVLPKEALVTTALTAASHTDLRSDSLRTGPRVAAFCLGIDSFAADELPPLSNCSRDAHYMASHLRQAVPTAQSGVQNVVHCCDNVTKLEFESAFASFESELANVSASSGPPDLVILFLASHGFQVDADVFVAFKDTHLGGSMQAEPRQCMAETCIDVALLINRIKLGYPGPLALIMDACRISPIPNLALHLTSLANRSNHPSNTLVCFSTCAGGVAADGGPLQHSPFFSALIRKLTVAEMSIRSAVDAACNLLGRDQGSVCVTFHPFTDVCLVPKMIDLLVIGGSTGCEADVASGQVGLVKFALERQSGRGDRIVVIGPREGSIPSDVATLCTHADIRRFELPLSNGDIAAVVAIWTRHFAT